MGHLGHLKEEYQALLRRLDGGQVTMPEPRDPRAWEGWKEILELCFSPAEAEIACHIPPAPSRLEKIATRAGLDPEEMRKRLEPMCEKGIVVDVVHPETGHVKYMLAPPVVGFFEFSMMRAHDTIPKKRMAEALDAYEHGDPAFAEEVFGSDTVIGRSMVNENFLGDTPIPEVLDFERTSALIDKASKWALAICFCRHKNEHLGKDCDAPKEICLSINTGADFVIRREFGRAIEKQDAMQIVEDARKGGLVQIADNVLNQPTYICNCCGCCCGQLGAINEYDLPAVNPSGFVPTSDPETCAGCARCARACPIGAITLTPTRKTATRKNSLAPSINTDRCIGCGVCANSCKKGAMTMVRREKQPYVPRNAVERALRMSIERGRLGHLLFDEAAGRGSRFMGQVVQTLIAMPGAQRALASEQVSSRFLKVALSRVKDPTGG